MKDTQTTENPRLTKIVCTLGPSCCTDEQIKVLAETGMNIARINVSHGSPEEHAKTIKMIQNLNDSGDYCIGILIDTKGAEIRSEARENPLEILEGEEVIFSPRALEGESKKVIVVNYEGFANDVKETDRILVDNGEMTFSIDDIREDGTVLSTANDAGFIGSRRHVNLPGADIDLPSITESDWRDIEYAVDNGADFVALSFIRTADEVQSVQDFLKKKKSHISVIAKIETKKSVENIEDIIKVSDGIMVARGDLGADVPFEDLPVIQNEIVDRCRDAGKPVIVATHMLESMIEHPMPTRAEVTDVAYAAENLVDATMLSGETASGKHPTKAVDAMSRTVRKMESYLRRFPPQFEIAVHDRRESQAEAAVHLADSIEAHSIVVFTRSGRTAADISKFRPDVPILAITPESFVQRSLQLLYGVFPYVVAFEKPEDTVEKALKLLKSKARVQEGQRVVLISDIQSKDTPISSIQVREI